LRAEEEENNEAPKGRVGAQGREKDKEQAVKAMGARRRW